MSARVHARRLAVDHVLHLLIDHPKGNILSLEVMQQLRAALAEARDDRGLRCVLLQGAGGNFSFGASVEEHRRAQAPAMLAGFHALIRDIADFPVPVVAVVEGRCLGGAFEVLLACHFVLATPNAQVGCPEIRLGVFPPVLAALGPLRLGMALTERLMLSGDTVGRDALERAGVLTADAARGGRRRGHHRRAGTWYTPSLSATLRAAPCGRRRCARGVDPRWRQPLGEAARRPRAQYVERVVTSHDGNEGIAAFLARRRPCGRTHEPTGARLAASAGRAEILAARRGSHSREHGFHGMSMRAPGHGDGPRWPRSTTTSTRRRTCSSPCSRRVRSAAGVRREAIESTPDADARLYAFIANHVSYVTEHRDVMRVLVHEAAALRPEQRRELRRLKDAYFALARELMDALYDAPIAERERATYSLFGMINWVFAWYEPARHGSPFEVARTIHRMTLAGLRNGAALGAEVDRVERVLRARPTPLRPSVPRWNRHQDT